MSRPPLIIIDILTLPDLDYRSTASKHEVVITSALLLFSCRIFAITSSSAGVRYVVWGTYRPSHNYVTECDYYTDYWCMHKCNLCLPKSTQNKLLSYLSH